MSDLQCPATLLVVGHGEARDAEPDEPAMRAAGTARGRRQAADLSAAVRRYSVAAVYTSGLRCDVPALPRL